MHSFRLIGVLVWMITSAHAQTSTLVSRFESLNYSVKACPTFESFTQCVDTTRADTNTLVCFKVKQRVLGVVFQKKESTIHVFLEDEREAQALLYTVNPQFKLGSGTVGYTQLMQQLFYAFDLDVKTRTVAAYPVFKSVAGYDLLTYTDHKLLKSKIQTERPIALPDFSSEKAIATTDLSVRKLKIVSEKQTPLQLATHKRPLNLYFLVCTFGLSPEVCASFDTTAVFL